MSTSQKYKGYSIVPWYNTAEWQNVFKLIISKRATKDDHKQALDIITMWQMRSTHLPSGIEGTLCILEALLIDNQNLTERQYQILAASGIMRFLNICVAHRAQVNSFTRTARDNRIPDWIISIRHDFAHSQKLPSISLLKLALKESFRWLETTYWRPEFTKMADNIISGVNTVEAKFDACSLEMHELMGLYCNVFVYDAKDLCYDEFIQDKLELVDALSKIDEYPKAIVYLLEQGVENLGDYEWDKCIDECIYSCFFLVNPKSLIDKKGNCNQPFYNLGILFNLIQKHDKLPLLIKELLCYCANERETTAGRVGAALWLDEIFKGMLKCKKKKSDMSELNSVDLVTGVSFKQLRKVTVQAVQKLKQFVLLTVPEELRKYFIINFLILLSIKDIPQFIKELNKKPINHPTNEIEDSLKLQQEAMDYETTINEFLYSQIDDSNESMVETKPLIKCKREVPEKRWSLVSDSTMFESCAIGVIPPQ